jgi:hypothetical protein
MNLRLITVAVLIALLGLVVAPATAGAAPKPSDGVPIPVTGTGSFTGTFNLKKFVSITNADGTPGVAVVGDVLDASGAVAQPNVQWPIDLAATAQANQAAQSNDGAVAAMATCDILKLVLGPLHLDLLGLVIDLNQVVLTITGLTGQGELLGNLLCGIAGIFDAAGLLQQLLGSLTQLNTLLEQVNGILGSLLGSNGVLSGNMLVNNFSSSGEQILANGTLAGQPISAPLDLAATRAANGMAGGAVMAGVMAAPAATCDVLNLVLAPLHLDVLGLNVDLSQVILNITAQSGAGNLLGNLLCAVTHLLDGPAPLAGLVNQLNHILRVLGGA